MSKVKLFFILLVLLFLSACSHFADSNRISPPADTKSIASLKTPPGMALSFDTLYPIPQSSYSSKITQVDITPPSLDINKAAGRGWFSW